MLWCKDRVEVFSHQPHQLCRLSSPTFVLEFIIHGWCTLWMCTTILYDDWHFAFYFVLDLLCCYLCWQVAIVAWQHSVLKVWKDIFDCLGKWAKEDWLGWWSSVEVNIYIYTRTLRVKKGAKFFKNSILKIYCSND